MWFPPLEKDDSLEAFMRDVDCTWLGILRQMTKHLDAYDEDYSLEE